MRSTPLHLLILLGLAVAPAPFRQQLPSPPIEFRISFHNNLHQFLYVLGRAQNGAPDAQREAVVNAPRELDALAGRSAEDRAAWQSAIDFYANGLSKQDAVFDKELITTTQALAPFGNGIPPVDHALAIVLSRAAPVYNAVWWAAHRHADEARRDDLERFVRQYGTSLAVRLTEVYHTQWPPQPRVVNLAAYTNWAGAYSTDNGLIEFTSTDPSIAGAAGLETLFHESSHQWDEEMEQRLSRVAAAIHAHVPRALSHALIFYTSGEVVKECIPEHVPYADRNGIWSRGGMRGVKPVLDEYWKPYLHGTGTIDDALAKVVSHLQ
jgi:hypothetical protein